MNMKKYGLLCVLLALLLVLPILASCGKKDPTPTPSGTDPKTDEATEPSTAEEDPEPNVNYAKDGVPTDFTIAVRNNRYHYLYCDDANTKDTVEYDTFRRNAGIEDQYGIKFKLMTLSDAGSGKEFSTKLDTGSAGDIDLMCWDFWWALEQKGAFVDLQTLPEIDLNKDWYYSGWNNNVTINGITFSCAGDATLEVLENIEVVFFNKNIAAAQSLDLYKIVDDKEWTIAKMRELMAQVSQNLDDEDKTNDVWGAIYDQHSLRTGLFSAGLKLVTVSQENGAIDITLNTPRNVNITDGFTALIHDANTYYSNTTARNYADKVSKFIGGQSFFYATALYCGKQIKNEMDASFDYGLIPMPKFDADSEYVSTTYGASIFSIPKICQDRSMSAVILDVMNRRSSDTIVTAFYDNVLKRKVAESPTDARMVDLARNSLYVDFGFVCESDRFNLFTKVQGQVVKNQSLSTVIAEIATAARNQLDSIIEIYR